MGLPVMPDFRKYRATILCEDEKHFQFIRGFFIEIGLESRKITSYAGFSDGLGAGDQHVRKHFPDALSDIRRRQGNVFLVVVTDADKEGADARTRRKELEKALTDIESETISDTERLLLVIPKRNIETWFAWIDGGGDVNENNDYKKQYQHAKSKKYGKRFKEELNKLSGSTGTGVDCNKALPSLRDAYDSFMKFCRILDERHATQSGSR